MTLAEKIWALRYSSKFPMDTATLDEAAALAEQYEAETTALLTKALEALRPLAEAYKKAAAKAVFDNVYVFGKDEGITLSALLMAHNAFANLSTVLAAQAALERKRAMDAVIAAARNFVNRTIQENQHELLAALAALDALNKK